MISVDFSSSIQPFLNSCGKAFLFLKSQLFSLLGASLVAQLVKCLPAMLMTQVQSLGREDPVEKEMPTHSSTLAWEIPWTEETGGLLSMGSQRVGHDLETKQQ